MKRLWIILLLLCTSPAWVADKHMGVATCASSVCHGSSAERNGANIYHNEYVIWGQRDPHARAYETLLSDESKRMAQKLGIGPAHEAQVCLACHSDYVPEAQRGPRFQLSDGVGCEACHGGSQRWLSSHTEKGTTHEDNLRRGLNLLQHADVRAAICAGCHVGDSTRLATHDIMGAGHPRLQFELATYHQLWPSHHRDDDNYRRRKQSPDAMKLWTAGQLRSARNLLEGLRGPQFMATPLWPELAFFDCHACHAAMDADKWQPRAAGKLRPGAVRLNDSALLMVAWLLDATDPVRAARWRDELAALHQASQQGRGAIQQSSAALIRQLDQLHQAMDSNLALRPDASQLLTRIRADTLSASYNDYMTAEQVLMVTALLRAPGKDAALDGLYRSLANQHRFSAREFIRALKEYEQQP
jgi:hypothetical protein